MDDLAILIPVNRLDRAKGRLADVLSPEQRSEVALATLTTTWEAARDVTDHVFVLTADARVPALLGPKARMIEESTAITGLNGQLQTAIDGLRAQLGAAGALLILHADLPLATAGAIERLVAALPGQRGVAIVRSLDGGTNAMVAHPAPGFGLRYGVNSAALHEHAAREAGYAVAFHESPELALDLDRPADLDALLRHPAGPSTRAGRALSAMGFTPLRGARA